tara:strand:- start:8 stop:793 length:786 start_codon:yes stop_codon:yes gene_type:complete
MKIDLDKYYTNEGIVNHCIKVVAELGINYTEVIEPSAGDGAFSLKIPNCIAYDIAPEHESVIEQDFLKLELPYKENRLIIGNPPFGSRNSLSVKFFKHSVDMCDYIAFILPVSQYNNNQQMYEFDLIHSEVLPLIEFSGRKLLCCFNIYKRPENGLNKTKINYKLNDVTILEWRRGGTYEIPLSYDLGICSWGASIGKEIKEQGQFALENYIIVNKPELKEKIIKLLLEVDWCDLYPNIATPRLGQWKIYKYLKEQIPELT